MDTIRQRREHMIEMQEVAKAKHWEKEKKLIMKYEVCDCV